MFVKRSLNLLQLAFVLYLLTVLTLAGCGGSSGSASSAGFTATASSTTTLNLTQGTAMVSFTPLTATGGAPPYTYTYGGILPPGLSFDSTTGAVTGTPTSVYYPTALLFKVQDANGVLASTTSDVTFSVESATTITAIANTTAPTLNVAVPMSNFYPLAPSGGTTPYTYSVTSGVLPAGLRLNTSSGEVMGTPSSTSAVSATFSVQDAINYVASTTSTVNFTVGTVTVYPILVMPTTLTLVQGSSMTPITALTAAGGTPPYTFGYTATLPAGLSLDSGTGILSGTPTTGGGTITSVIFKVTDSTSIPVTVNAASSVAITVN